jgi:hypothetical protein
MLNGGPKKSGMVVIGKPGRTPGAPKPKAAAAATATTRSRTPERAPREERPARARPAAAESGGDQRGREPREHVADARREREARRELAGRQVRVDEQAARHPVRLDGDEPVGGHLGDERPDRRGERERQAERDGEDHRRDHEAEPDPAAGARRERGAAPRGEEREQAPVGSRRGSGPERRGSSRPGYRPAGPPSDGSGAAWARAAA